MKIRNFQIWEFVRSVKFRLKQWFLPVSRSVTAKQALDLPNCCFWTGFWTKPNDYFYENLNSLFRLKVLQICLKLCCVSYLRSLNGYEGAKLQNRHFWSLFIRNIDFVFHGNSEFQVSFDTASDLSQTAFVEGFVFIYRAASSKLPKRALFRLYWSKIDLAYFWNLKFTNFRYFALLRFRKLKNIILLKHHFTEFLRKLKNPEKTSF